MANYFVDSTTGDDGDNGTTMDLAWATLSHAASQALSPGDRIWIRRVHSETVAAVINITTDGTAASPIQYIGWPRAADATADGATWTNGSTTVDLVTTLSMDTEKHVGRFVTGPDGFDYLITKITDANTFIIDREYAGSTVTLTDGAFTIKADEDWVDDMGTEYGFDDSGWTIKEAAWDADADDLPVIDFNSGAFYLYIYSDNYIRIANMQFKDGVSTALIFVRTSVGIELQGLLLTQSVNSNSLYGRDAAIVADRIIATGSSAGSAQRGLSNGGPCDIIISNSAFYSFGDNGILISYSANLKLDNVNIGVEGTCGDDDLELLTNAHVTGRDVKFGGNISEVAMSGTFLGDNVSIENYNKVLGSHKTYSSQGEVTKVDVVSGSGDPYKRTGGNDSVIEILHNGSVQQPSANLTKLSPIFVHEFDITMTESKNYRYYVQAEDDITATELWLEATYVVNYDDDSEYVIKTVSSDESVAVRDDASDWDQYIEVTSIAPVVSSKVRIACYCSYYDAANKIYIDPLVEIT